MITKFRMIRLLGFAAGILILVLSSIAVYHNYFGSKVDETAVHFLPVLGQVHYAPGEDFPIDILFYASNKNQLVAKDGEMIEVQTDNKALSTISCTFEKGTEYKGMTLYAIHFSFMAKQKGSYTISKIILEDKSGLTHAYDIGKIDIDIQKPDPYGTISIQSYVGSADLGAAYSFSVKNIDSKSCIITNINFGSLQPIITDLHAAINNKEVDEGKDIVLKPGELLSISADLNTHAGKDILLVSPELHYKMQGDSVEHTLTLPHGIMGLSVAEKKMLEIYRKYFQL